MRFILSLSGLFLIICSLSVGTLLPSCTKDKTIFDTVTVIKKDTLVVQDTLLIKDSSFSKALLTAYPWKETELIAVWGGDSIYYYRGGTNNTTGFGDRSIETYTFNSDGTGSLLDVFNNLHNITNWQFVNSDNTKLTFLVNDPPSSKTFMMTWDNIRYKSGNIFTDDYYFDNYANKYYHGQAIRYQVK